MDWRNLLPRQDEIRSRYGGTDTMEQIAADYGASTHSIRQMAKSLGWPRRGHGGQPRNWTKTEIETVLMLRDKGWSQDRIGRELGLSQSAVRRKLLALEEPLPRSGYATGPYSGAWKGGRIVTKEGYVWVQVQREDPLSVMRNNAGYVQEHRLVMARHLGRPLHPWETVHHKDEPKSDNRLENLQLRVGRHGKGHAYCCADCGSRRIKPIDLE